MATCKECLSELPCSSNLQNMYHNKAGKCPFFKNKSEHAEVKRGKWKVNVGMNFNKERICLICGEEIKGNHWNFCSNCGAKMNGGKKE